MAVAVAPEDQLKADLAAAKKLASGLQKEVDDFAVERKSHADFVVVHDEAQADLAKAKLKIDLLEAQLKDAQDELAVVNKQFSAAQKQVEAAQKIKEGLAGLA